MRGKQSVDVEKEVWGLRSPFNISNYTFTEISILVANITDGNLVGRGEAAGVYYHNDTFEKMASEIEEITPELEAGLDRQALQTILEPGGARNAVDCAFWELEARRAGEPVWKLVGLSPPRRLLTVYTIGANPPGEMASAAQALGNVPALKLKLTGNAYDDAERVRAVRAVCPHAWISVDCNQGFTADALAELMPALVDAAVGLVEQPLPIGRESDLDGFHRAIPFAADESVQGLADIEGLIGRFDAINIKLDKCGGLTEALAMVQAARRFGLKVMVGNMGGTSLATAPGFVLGQLCDIVDLDGPMFLRNDRAERVIYADGQIWSPEKVWGGPW